MPASPAPRLTEKQRAVLERLDRRVAIKVIAAELGVFGLLRLIGFLATALFAGLLAFFLGVYPQPLLELVQHAGLVALAQ